MSVGDPLPRVGEASATERGLLTWLWAEVVRARSREADQLRLRGARPDELREARKATLDALTAYVDAIEGQCWPVPRRLQLEIALHQALCGHRPAPRHPR